MSVDGDDIVMGRFRQQAMVGDPQTAFAKPCETCGRPVYWVEGSGYWVIKRHTDPGTGIECPESLKKQAEIK